MLPSCAVPGAPSYHSRLSSYTLTLLADTLAYLILCDTDRLTCVKTYQFAEINGRNFGTLLPSPHTILPFFTTAPSRQVIPAPALRVSCPPPVVQKKGNFLGIPEAAPGLSGQLVLGWFGSPTGTTVVVRRNACTHTSRCTDVLARSRSPTTTSLALFPVLVIFTPSHSLGSIHLGSSDRFDICSHLPLSCCSLTGPLLQPLPFPGHSATRNVPWLPEAHVTPTHF